MLRLNHALSAFAIAAILFTGTSSYAVKAKKNAAQTFNEDHSGDPANAPPASAAAAPAQPVCPTPPPCPQCPACPAASADAPGTKVTVQWAGADETDHHRVINHWSLAAFTSPGLNIGSAAAGGVATSALPILGTRYWMKEGDAYDWGIDVGLGLLISTSSNSTTVPGTTTNTPAPAPLGFWLHGGMPFALYSGQHYTFELIPQLDIAYVNQSVTNAGVTNSQHGFHFQAGGQVGPEIHFGFMNIPELSVQPTLGLFLSYTTNGASTTTGGNTTSNSTGTFLFGTQSGTVLGAFGALNVFYYF